MTDSSKLDLIIERLNALEKALRPDYEVKRKKKKRRPIPTDEQIRQQILSRPSNR